MITPSTTTDLPVLHGMYAAEARHTCRTATDRVRSCRSPLIAGDGSRPPPAGRGKSVLVSAVTSAGISAISYGLAVWKGDRPANDIAAADNKPKGDKLPSAKKLVN
ncbi:hypothetical protein AB0J86_14585 [Micromonospora sp. NPDC049559]|uniref:hypothetical protein n=1 Tax=Micromonospora sp. NPDC049559 TaxID=3155923 RepID=UPI0034167349